MTSLKVFGIASGAFLFLNGIIGNSFSKSYAKLIAFYKTHSSLGLSISMAPLLDPLKKGVTKWNPLNES